MGKGSVRKSVFVVIKLNLFLITNCFFFFIVSHFRLDREYDSDECNGSYGVSRGY